MLKIRLFVLLMLAGLRVFPQVTPNIGFDDGTFTNWDCWAGDVLKGLSLNLTGPVSFRHTIISEKTNSKDPYGGFPTLCPNGSKYSIRLGNSISGAQAERVSYTFTVPATGDYSIIFDYAVVLQNPNHAPEEQPRFTAQVYSLSDNKYIDCPTFDFIAGDGSPGFVPSDMAVGTSGDVVFYKDWSKAIIDLHGYANKVMRIEFTTNDCTKGAHFGYAYLDVENSDTTTPITGNAYCIGQNEVTLLGPTGFADYTWFDANDKYVGTGRSLTLSPAPPNNTPYKLHVTPYLGLGCEDDLYTVVNKINADFKLVVQDVINICPGTSADLTAPAVTAGSTAVANLSYFKDAAANEEITNPKSMGAGTYYIRALSKDGCSNTLPVTVVVQKLPALKVTNPPAVTYPATADLSTTFTHDAGITYSYFTSVTATEPLAGYDNISKSGTYYIKATNVYGCDTVAPVKILVNPPPPIVVTSPNTFTPNGDGVNDHFSFSAVGIYTFTNLKIYNRNGALLFMAKSPTEYWDGTYKGKALPAAVYYWVFEGVYDYNGTRINKGGSIALIR